MKPTLIWKKRYKNCEYCKAIELFTSCTQKFCYDCGKINKKEKAKLRQKKQQE